MTEPIEKNTVAIPMDTGMEVQYVNVNDLNPNSYNPNRQTDRDFELLLSSMRADGFTQPVIAIRSNKEIVDGEHRWRAAIALDAQGEPGFKEIPVVFVDMTPQQQRISTLRHNRARGSEDVNLAAEVLRDLASRGATDFAIAELDMTPDEMEYLLQEVALPEVYDSPEVAQAKNDFPDDNAVLADATRAAEKRIATEKADEAREIFARDRDTFRVDLAFGWEEWAIVKASLGDSPAQRLLELCRASIENTEVPA